MTETTSPTLLEQARMYLSRIGSLTQSGWQRGVEWAAAADARLIMACVLLTIGLYLLLPSRRRLTWRVTGAILGGAGVACLLSLVPGTSLSLTAVSFALLASMTIIAAVGTVSSQRPVYCAIWFALTLFGVGSLLLINGAQFLAVATVAIYAGAIVVTLLFVLMLAQPEGHTPYDRISWGRLAQWLACFAGAASTCLLVWAFLQTPLPTGAVVATKNPTLTTDHVAALGAVMFSRYLIAVELGGLLLFAALVGAVSIAAIPSRDLDRQLDQALGGPASAGAVPHE